MAKTEKFNIEELIQALQGTCKSISEILNSLYDGETEEEDLSDEDRQAIDEEIFLCETCRWWCERCEESEDEFGTCVSCVE